MKPSREEREKLAGLIRKRRQKSGFSNSELASLAGVDPGQTSRILDGQFRTISGNVLRICNALGFDPHTAAPAEPSGKQARRSAAWAKLEASVRRAWDETSLDADRLVAVIDAVAKIKPRKRGKEFSVDTSSVRNPLG
ncbi:transcriptional regulator [Mesorhizobium sp. LNJC374B00]|nr:transcriptional regulator [Mesorhizobium sp. LNJC374B00]